MNEELKKPRSTRIEEAKKYKNEEVKKSRIKDE